MIEIYLLSIIAASLAIVNINDWKIIARAIVFAALAFLMIEMGLFILYLSTFISDDNFSLVASQHPFLLIFIPSLVFLAYTGKQASKKILGDISNSKIIFWSLLLILFLIQQQVYNYFVCLLMLLSVISILIFLFIRKPSNIQKIASYLWVIFIILFILYPVFSLKFISSVFWVSGSKSLVQLIGSSYIFSYTLIHLFSFLNILPFHILRYKKTRANTIIKKNKTKLYSSILTTFSKKKTDSMLIISLIIIFVSLAFLNNIFSILSVTTFITIYLLIFDLTNRNIMSSGNNHPK